SESDELAARARALEARERRLRSQRARAAGRATAEHLQHRITADPSRVVLVGVAQRDREDPLAKELAQAVLDTPLLAALLERLDEPRRQADTAIDRAQQHGTTVRAPLLPAELDHHRPLEDLFKQGALGGSV